MTTEEWRPVPGFEGKYEVSNLGNVRSWTPRKRGELLKPRAAKKTRYLRVGLYDETGRLRMRSVHQLVLEAFHGPKPPGCQGCHNDGNRLNNNASNLRWGTQSENSRDGYWHRKNPGQARPDRISIRAMEVA